MISNVNIQELVQQYLNDKSKLLFYLQKKQIGEWDVSNVECFFLYCNMLSNVYCNKIKVKFSLLHLCTFKTPN